MENSDESTQNKNKNKQRHGCVTAWLVFVIIANAISALMYFFASQVITRYTPMPDEALILMGTIGVLNVLFAVKLYQWQRWGFWGFTISSVLVFVINLSIGLNAGQSFLGLLGIGLLYGILQIKENNKSGWDNLE